MLSILSLVKKYEWFSFGYQPSSIRIFSFSEVCRILANLKPFFPLNVFAGKKILYCLFIFAFSLILTNSVFSANCKSTGDLEDVSSNVFIKPCFHSSLLSCQMPKIIVKTIENIVKIKKG